ncbi:unnamed protein product [Meloidogyne enterolobii]|uniref:Uncharacterized protein n=1 Tax=Meloidogyne enterolobii TaxID=390850 RepID=A0ACB1APY9_MELEN
MPYSKGYHLYFVLKNLIIGKFSLFLNIISHLLQNILILANSLFPGLVTLLIFYCLQTSLILNQSRRNIHPLLLVYPLLIP